MRTASEEPPLEVRDLELRYGDTVVLTGVSFEVPRGAVLAIMGGSGCGKSTLMRCMIGLLEPRAGVVLYGGADFTTADRPDRNAMLRGVGVVFQGSALWSALTLAENVELVLEQHTSLARAQRAEIARLKLALVGLTGFEDHYPAQISGGMQRRAGLARALALDPRILLLDEPGAGLDPISARRQDRLLVELRESLEATIVIVTHELATILSIADDSVLLDADVRGILARGHPRRLLEESSDPRVQEFLGGGRKP